jgi:hypothetical protein
MRPLPVSFIHEGFRHTVLKREGRVVLVKVHTGEHYEVALVQRRRACRLPSGTVLPEREAMPTAAQWGNRGWSFMDRVLAERKFTELVSKPRARRGKQQAA